MALLKRVFTLHFLFAARAAATICTDPGSSGWTTTVLDASIKSNFEAHHKIVDATLHLRLSASTAGYLGFGFGEPSSGHIPLGEPRGRGKAAQRGGERDGEDGEQHD